MTTILAIDDDKMILENIEDIATINGYEVMTAPNGKIGVQTALAKLPDLIVCDVMMPELDGYGVLRELQEHAETSEIPFIFLTAQSTPQEFRYGMNLGADDYLTKPFDANGLMTAVQARLDKHAKLATAYEKPLENMRRYTITVLPHELRTPLIGILGMAEMLSESTEMFSYAEIKEMAAAMLKSGNRLHRLIENYLLYSQIYAAENSGDPRSMLIRGQSLCPATLVAETCAQKARKAGRSADLEIKNQRNTPIKIATDYLSKLVEEIFDNALKFSNVGTKIQVQTEVISDTFRITITDHGRGMTALQIKEIGALVQFDRERYEQQGSGLGLVIALGLIRLHQGSVDIASQVGMGTTFTIEFPVSHDLN